jgi:SAM-dependent methyltransferase
MQVRRPFEEIYATEEDPWAIGAADSARYRFYRDLILRHARTRGAALDIGCGFGAFLATLEGEFEHLRGVEVSSTAIEKGARRFPFISFEPGSADDLASTRADGERYDLVVFSDVIAYLDEPGKERSLDWIANHLTDGGLAFVAAWSPGGRYLTYGELDRLVRRHFAIEAEHLLDSNHAVFLARRKRRKVTITVDYETWQPVPANREIDWDADVFEPTGRLLEIFDAAGARLTLFAEIGEYLWLAEHGPEVARRMADQWRDAVGRGHDVQLHLHPTWLPEVGARREGDTYVWDWSRARVHDYPGDLSELIRRAKSALQKAIHSVAPDHQVVAYRAGAYEVQPFTRLYDALLANGIFCDSSVYRGGRHPERHYDFSLALSGHQPWFAARTDAQLGAPPAERGLVELPIFAPEPGQRWTFDGSAGARFADVLLEHLDREPSWRDSSEAHRVRARARARLLRLIGETGIGSSPARHAVPRALARFAYGLEAEPPRGDEYYVLVGHSKGDLDFDSIAEGMARLVSDPRVDVVTLGDAARDARADLEAEVRAVRPSLRGSRAKLGGTRLRQTLLDRVPFDRERLWDLGGEPPSAAPPFAARPDTIVADDVLSRVDDVDGLLLELWGALDEGGVLVASVLCDALHPELPCTEHLWRTEPRDVLRRLRMAGFVDVRFDEVDLLRCSGCTPHPPSGDRVLVLQAWRRDAALTSEGRVDEAMSWLYHRLAPGADGEPPPEDLASIMERGEAWCAGYALALGLGLRREGFRTRFVSMIAEPHPRGRGPSARDTHEVVEVTLPNGARHVCDPMSNVRFAWSLPELLANPSRADSEHEPDDRWRERGYDLYATSFWYERVVAVAIREEPFEDQRFFPPEKAGELPTPQQRLARESRRMRRWLGARRDRLRGRSLIAW